MLLYFSTLNLKSKEEARKSGEILPPIFNRETGLRSLPRMRYNSPKLQSLKLGVWKMPVGTKCLLPRGGNAIFCNC